MQTYFPDVKWFTCLSAKNRVDQLWWMDFCNTLHVRTCQVCLNLVYIWINTSARILLLQTRIWPGAGNIPHWHDLRGCLKSQSGFAHPLPTSGMIDSGACPADCPNKYFWLRRQEGQQNYIWHTWGHREVCDRRSWLTEIVPWWSFCVLHHFREANWLKIRIQPRQKISLAITQ